MQYGDILTYLKYLQSINVRLLRSKQEKEVASKIKIKTMAQFFECNMTKN